MIVPSKIKRPAPRILIPVAAILLVMAPAAALTGCQKPAIQPNLPQAYFPLNAARRGKPPIIFIPGILGSSLVNRRTGHTVWPDLMVDSDAIALPISSPVLSQNTDEIVAEEVVENAKVSALIPEISIYGSMLESLERYGGYRRGRIDAPPPGGDCDTLYLFAYDWRRDLVESAHALGCRIEELKRKLGRPDLRFDIVTHSMGGLVARYYAMYGGRDVLDDPVASPDWSGAQNLNRVVMIATPNAGSISALRVLLRGFSALSFARPFGYMPFNLGRKLPFARVGPRVTFTVPAIYQMLPPEGEARFLSSTLTQLPVDLYDVETWRRYKWSAAFDSKSRRKEFEHLVYKLGPSAAKAESLRRALERERFLQVVLRRSEAFHEALAVECQPPPSLSISLIGADCLPTLDAAVIFKGMFPRTIFSIAEFRGDKESRRKAEDLMFADGDGTITLHSLFGRQFNAQQLVTVSSSMRSPRGGATLFCDTHNGLTHDRDVQNTLLKELILNR
jgi:pimeloyl-ACP methyl ester carboxylesterase